MSGHQLTRAVPKPGHVADSLVYDFDMFYDPAYNADPHDRILDLLQDAPPVFWTPRHGGHWMAMSYEANFNAARDSESFSSEMIPYKKISKLMALQKLVSFFGLGGGRIPLPFPILLDPPLHTMYRRPLQAVFSPKNILALEGGVRSMAIELIEQVKDQGRCEFMSAIAEPLPVKVFLKMFGLPVEKLGEYRALLKEYMGSHSDEANPRRKMITLRRVADAMRETMLQRRENPCEDIISYLWQTEIDGKPMTLDVMENFGVLLFIAGLDTVMQAMGYAVRHLALDQSLQTDLRSNHDNIDDNMEEIFRRYNFVVPARRVARDLEFLGVKMKKNDIVMLFLPAANLDSAQFPEPERINSQRVNKAHIAFNAGVHHCLGSHLARMELRILYQELLSRLPPFKLDAGRPPKFGCGHVLGIETLDVVWDPPGHHQ